VSKVFIETFLLGSKMANSTAQRHNSEVKLIEIYENVFFQVNIHFESHFSTIYFIFNYTTLSPLLRFFHNSIVNTFFFSSSYD